MTTDSIVANGQAVAVIVLAVLVAAGLIVLLASVLMVCPERQVDVEMGVEKGPAVDASRRRGDSR